MTTETVLEKKRKKEPNTEFNLNKKDICNFTVISNRVLNDKTLSYKALGMICKLLSFPNDFNVSVNGLVYLSDDGVNIVRSCLKELINKGYLTVEQKRNDKGIFEKTVYSFVLSKVSFDIKETHPRSEKPHTDNPQAENPLTENPLQTNTYIYNHLSEQKITEQTLTPSDKKTETITEYNNGLAIACEPNGFVASNNEETVQISDYKECYDEVLSVMDKVTDKHIDNSIKDNINNTEKELPNEQENYSISPQQTNKQKVKQKKTTEQTRFTIEKYPHDDYYKKIALLINENRGRFAPIKFITEKFICGVDNMLELVSEQDYETALINMFDKDSYVQYPNYSSDLYTYIFDKDKIIQFLEIDFKAERERKEKKLMFDKYVSLFKETFQYSYSTKDNYHNATQLFFALSREQMECAILNIPEVFKRESIEPKIDEYLYKELYIIPETVVKEEIIEEEIILIDENELDI